MELKEVVSGDEGWEAYADDIGIEDKEGRFVLGEDVTGQGKRAGCAKRLRLNGEGNSDVVLFFILL